ncbi:MAG: SagB/ThcOx family dehydrogenase [Firmicutes bacterium]|nr:SagB/ThcOx family dehydrogenase [Bacillota bacterium]
MEKIPLPPAVVKGEVTVEEAIYRRISRRSFQEQGLTLAQAGQLLWSAAGSGATGDSGISRAAPSAGATYPLDFYLAAGDVEGLDTGLYYYDYRAHALEMLQSADLRARLAHASLGQEMVARAPLCIVIAARYERTTRRYGERGYRYVYMEAGYVSQNIYLQAEAMELATVAVGAFGDAPVKEILGIEGAPLLLMPVGAR